MSSRTLVVLVTAGILWPLALSAEHPKNQAARCSQLLAGGSADRVEEAIALCTQAVESGGLSVSDLTVTYSNMSAAFFRLKSHDKAVEHAGKAIALDPTYASAFVNRGNAYAKTDRPDLAIADYDRALEIDPDMADALHYRGLSRADKGQHERAIADFEKALRVDPRYANARAALAVSLAKLNELDRAIENFDAAIALEPGNKDLLADRAEFYERAGLTDLALTGYNDALALDGEYSRAYIGRGLTFTGLGQYDKAIADFDRAVETGSSVAVAWQNRAVAAFLSRRYERALEDLGRAITTAPAKPSAYRTRGLIFAWLDRRALATKDFATTIDVAFPTQKDDWLGQICKELALIGRPRLALNYCERALSQTESAANLDHRAFVWWQLGADEKARTDLAKAHRLDPARQPDPDRRLSMFPVLLAQGLLDHHGHRVGDIDGAVDQRTRDAIIAFQSEQGLAADGRVTPDLIASLKEARAAAVKNAGY